MEERIFLKRRAMRDLLHDIDVYYIQGQESLKVEAFREYQHERKLTADNRRLKCLV